MNPPTSSPHVPVAPGTAAPRHNPLWWIVAAAFALQLVIWAVWFTIAAHHRVAEVPLAARPAR